MSPEAGWEGSIIKIVAVYHTYPVMLVGETADGALLERSLHELADRPELLPPRSEQELVEQYRSFRAGERRQGWTVSTVRPPAWPDGMVK